MRGLSFEADSLLCVGVDQFRLFHCVDANGVMGYERKDLALWVRDVYGFAEVAASTAFNGATLTYEGWFKMSASGSDDIGLFASGGSAGAWLLGQRSTGSIYGGFNTGGGGSTLLSAACGAFFSPAAHAVSTLGTGNPAVVNTTAAHGLVTGDYVTISGVTGGTYSPTINGTYVVTVSDSDTFTVTGVNCTVAGSGGTIQALGPHGDGWHHVAITLSGGTHKLLLDGLEKDSDTGATPTGTNRLVIGGFTANNNLNVPPDYPLEGQVRDFRISSVVRTYDGADQFYRDADTLFLLTEETSGALVWRDYAKGRNATLFGGIIGGIRQYPLWVPKAHAP